MAGVGPGPPHPSSSGIDEIQNEEGAHPVVGETLPELGHEQHQKSAGLDYRGTSASTNDCNRARAAGTPSTRKRAWVAPGPTLMVTAGGGRATNKSSSVRSSPVARGGVGALRVGGRGGEMART